MQTDLFKVIFFIGQNFSHYKVFHRAIPPGSTFSKTFFQTDLTFASFYLPIVSFQIFLCKAFVSLDTFDKSFCILPYSVYAFNNNVLNLKTILTPLAVFIKIVNFTAQTALKPGEIGWFFKKVGEW